MRAGPPDRRGRTRIGCGPGRQAVGPMHDVFPKVGSCSAVRSVGVAVSAALLLVAAGRLSAPIAAAEGRMAPARPGEVAIRQEFEAARRAGTRGAYTQFIIRHSDHPLAEVARRERARLATPARRRSC
jgi:hypothetical protein